MRAFSMEEIAEITGGTLVSGSRHARVTNVSKDSRDVCSDSLFFAIIGKNHDAHNFLPQVFENGCFNWVVSHQNYPPVPCDCSTVNIVLVQDTTQALITLAVYALNEMKTKKIAVTGSVGKTSTKDMVYAICKQKYRTGRTVGNLNTNIGISMCVLGFEPDTEVAVLEIGTDHPGEIEEIVGVFHPDIALITNIGQSHLEHFGTREGIFHAKMEITKFFNEKNTLIIQKGSDFLRKEHLQSEGIILSVGTEEDNDYIISDIFSKMGETRFVLKAGTDEMLFRLPVTGAHQACNAAQAVAAGKQLGISWKDAAEGLAHMEMTPGRLEVKKCQGPCQITVIDDSYNASPDSMKAGIQSLMSLSGERKVAILGDMFELGPDTAIYHREVGTFAKKSGVDLVIGVGPLSKYLVEAAGNRTRYYPTKQELLSDLHHLISDGDVILVKASRGMALDEVVTQIMSMKETT